MQLPLKQSSTVNLLTIAGSFADAMARRYYTDEDVVGFFCEGDSALNDILMDGSDDELGFEDEIEISEHDHDDFDFLPSEGKYYK